VPARLRSLTTITHALRNAPEPRERRASGAAGHAGVVAISKVSGLCPSRHARRSVVIGLLRGVAHRCSSTLNTVAFHLFFHRAAAVLRTRAKPLSAASAIARVSLWELTVTQAYPMESSAATATLRFTSGRDEDSRPIPNNSASRESLRGPLFKGYVTIAIRALNPRK
jgi:hypothetical protein